MQDSHKPIQIQSIISWGAILGTAMFALSVDINTQSVHARSEQAIEKVPNSYIVVFKDSADDTDGSITALAAKHGFTVQQTYHHALRGFTATIPSARLTAVKHDPRVQFVSEDRVVTTSARQLIQPAQITPTGVRRLGQPASSSNHGAGVTVAVIDTGIDLTHPDLKENIVATTSCVSRAKSGNDDNGHGSHVAGTIAARTNTIGVVGVAPDAKLVAVKVLDRNGSGTWSSVICGIDWITAHQATYNIQVANMSLGGSGRSDNACGLINGDALHRALCRSRDTGITYIVAAGNDGANAAGSVPAAYDDVVITVSALADSDGLPGGRGAATSYGADDTFAGFSNYGTVVDLAAPGVNIYSTWKGGTYQTISGTSMATPHVAGAVALYVATHPGTSWSAVRDALRTSGEATNAGHTDPSGNHPEPVIQAASF